MKQLLDLYRDRLAPKITGTLIALAVVGYTGSVFARGGFYDSTQPRSSADLGKAITEFAAGKQDPKELASKSRNHDGGVGEVSAEDVRHVFEIVDEGIMRHRAIARHEMTLPEGRSNDFVAFKKNEIPKLDAGTLPNLPDVHPLSILYKPDSDYEILATSPRNPEEVFDDYLRKLVAAKWLVASAYLETRRARGVINAISNGRVFVLAVQTNTHFDGGGTTVHWELILGADAEDD